MKTILLISITFLVASVSYSQVTNDDCFTATDLGFIEYVSDTTSLSNSWNCFDGMAHMDTGFYYASTENALINYPYPVIDIQCNGYANYITGQYNDVWYKATGVSCDLIIAFTCSDTTHLSVWSGNDCSSLCPEKCYTLLPGAYFYDTLYSIGSIPVYFQISGPSINAYIDSYSLCLEGSEITCPNNDTTCYTDFVTNIRELDKINGITISPNPSYGVFNINGTDIQKIEIIDINGKVVYQSNGKKQNIDISNQSEGIYFVKIITMKGIETKKILIE